MMRSTVVAILLLSFGTAYNTALLQDATRSSGTTVAWHWFQSCGGRANNLGLVVLIDGKSVYRSQFPVCRNNEPSPTRTIAFHIKGGHVFRGDIRTSPSQTIEVNIRQAGADPHSLPLSVTFAGDRVLLNTIHVAKPDSTSVSQLDSGIELRTFPIAQKANFR
jgi:hypothetical protein